MIFLPLQTWVQTSALTSSNEQPNYSSAPGNLRYSLSPICTCTMWHTLSDTHIHMKKLKKWYRQGWELHFETNLLLLAINHSFLLFPPIYIVLSSLQCLKRRVKQSYSIFTIYFKYHFLNASNLKLLKDINCYKARICILWAL